MASFNNNFNNYNSTKYINTENYKLTWNNISVWLKTRRNHSFWEFQRSEYVKILNDVSGVIYSGSIMAIIGSSGSGKTSLLTTISQRINGVIIGDIKLNDKTLFRSEMKKISGFIPQQEIIFGSLTVGEHLQFMARLKMKKTTFKVNRNQTILLTLNSLGLTNSSQTKISCLSQGELKKLSLAEQLLTDPPFLFCDELTTGLDSYNAEMVIKILRDLSNYGKAIICTIHQPTYSIFELFHQVTILTKGTMVYEGPTNKIHSYFESFGLHNPVGFNPIEFYISYLAKIQNNPIGIQYIREYFEKSKYFKNLKHHLSENNIYESNNSVCNKNKYYIDNSTTHSSEKIFEKDKNKINFCVQLYWLLWRCYINMFRNNKNILLRFAFYMFIALLLSTMFWDIASDIQQRDVQNLEGLFSLIITETIFTFTYSVLHTFPEELPKLLREVNDGLYDLEPYYLSKLISLFPLIIIETLLYSIIIYWSVGLSNSGLYGYLNFYLPVLFCALSSSAYGFALSTTFKSVATASLVSVPIDFIGMTYSGIYINIANLPWLTSWIPYISQFYYGNEAISVTQWENIDTLQCDNPELPCLNNGKSVLIKYGYKLNSYYFDLLGLFIYFVICHVISFISFKRKCKQQAVY